MRTHGYSAVELSGFYAALDSAVREAAELDLKLSVPVMVQRLFGAADAGERDTERLISAILGALPEGERIAPIDQPFPKPVAYQRNIPSSRTERASKEVI